jgi:hypothetical protein
MTELRIFFIFHHLFVQFYKNHNHVIKKIVIQEGKVIKMGKKYKFTVFMEKMLVASMMIMPKFWNQGSM